MQQKFPINIRFFSLLGSSIVHSTTNKKAQDSIPVCQLIVYIVHQGNLNCSVSYWELKLRLAIQPRNKFLWSRATKKGFEFLTVPMLSISDYLVTYWFMTPTNSLSNFFFDTQWRLSDRICFFSWSCIIFNFDDTQKKK